MENCLIEQLIGDVLYNGINGQWFWFDYICLADIVVLYNID